MRNSWLFPYDPEFVVVAFMERIHSPRLDDLPRLAQWIEDAAAEWNINQRWLLVTAQKEQSLLTRKYGGEGYARALLYAMGYGALDDGTDLQWTRGPKEQARLAARGLRFYLKPHSKHSVTDCVGKPFKLLSAPWTYTPQNLAEAAALRYTPHLHGITAIERIWAQWFGEENEVAKATKADVANIAREVCLEFAKGGRGKLILGRVTFNLTDVAYCARFVRECHEAAMEQAEYTWPYQAANAREMEYRLRVTGKETKAPKPGDIVCFNNGGGSWGHIGIHLSGTEFAENTSSKSRGPGFVISKYVDIGADRISGFYSVLPSAEKKTLKVVLLPGNEVIDCNPAIEDGVCRVDLRAVGEALGYQVLAHRLEDQNKVYLKPVPRIDPAAKAA